MSRLYEQRPKLDLFHPRDTLVRIHLDLLDVHAHIYRYVAYYPEQLTTLEKLTLALEDRRFFSHRGIDLKSALRECLRAILRRRHGGASTIDMQLVRTATGYRELTLSRKLYEILLAVLIQFRYSKIVILRSYLRCAYFGWNLRGENAAAKKVFGRPRCIYPSMKQLS
jgi:membrane peptidoglycan carboxypeptidase